MHDALGMGWGMGWTWIIGLIGILIAIIIVVRYNKRKDKTSLDILNERLAKGEISEKEYKKTKEMLQ